MTDERKNKCVGRRDDKGTLDCWCMKETEKMTLERRKREREIRMEGRRARRLMDIQRMLRGRRSKEHVKMMRLEKGKLKKGEGGKQTDGEQE